MHTVENGLLCIRSGYFSEFFFWLLLVILDRQHKRNFLKNFFLKEEIVIDGS